MGGGEGYSWKRDCYASQKRNILTLIPLRFPLQNHISLNFQFRFFRFPYTSTCDVTLITSLLLERDNSSLADFARLAKLRRFSKRQIRDSQSTFRFSRRERETGGVEGIYEIVRGQATCPSSFPCN